MDLFNKYKNKDFAYIINYINMALSYNKAMTPYSLSKFFIKTKSFKEVIKYVINKNNSILYKAEDKKIHPVYKNSIIMRLTYAERAWLYNILHDPKAELFLDRNIIDLLINDLEKSHNTPYTLSNNEMHILKLNDNPAHKYTIEEIGIFRKVMHVIYKKIYVSISMKQNNVGEKYMAENVIIYKIEYMSDDDTLHILYYNKEYKCLKKIPLLMIKNIKLGNNITEYDAIENEIKTAIASKRSTNPIVIEIDNKDNAFQRCTYKFALYDRLIYQKNDKIYMEIYYYRGSQQEDIIVSIMQLGKYIKVVSPSDIALRIKEEILARNEMFSEKIS